MWVTRLMAGLGGKLGLLGVCVAVSQMFGGGPARAESGPAKADAVALGYELFNREWMPGDPRGHGGDGLGPVYNDSSCVACHNSGGSGGGGPVSKNIDILNASHILAPVPMSGTAPKASASSTAAIDPLLAIHAGFRTSRTVVLHKFGTDHNYDAWRRRALRPAGISSQSPRVFDAVEFVTVPVLSREMEIKVAVNDRELIAQRPSKAGMRIAEIRAAVMASNPTLGQAALRVGQFSVSRSQRNPTALFGLGLIDAIPDEAIEAVAKREAITTPQTHGRVSRLKDGKIGRLGWKAQTANTEEFVLNACAVELGLEVPDHHQAISPQAPKYRTTGLDLTAGECNALVAYVRNLPRPIARKPAGAEEAKYLAAGKAAFGSIGCAGCHTPNLGEVDGLYSDLLLHDMGQEMADDGSYGDDGSDGDDDPLDPSVDPLAAKSSGKSSKPQSRKGATRQEWRTPPLWGFRDSGPYLHDGRAQTLEQAVALHGGQGTDSARKFFDLSPRERLQLEAFLKSLVAPPSTHLALRGE